MSYSGNTEEVAELIAEAMEIHRVDVTKYNIGRDYEMPDIKSYDLIVLGTFTWAGGSTPDEVKDFVADIGYKPPHVAIFGTGDTQFGGDKTFCLAATKLVKFYNSMWKELKIEQSPRGTQENLVREWTINIVQSYKQYQEKGKKDERV